MKARTAALISFACLLTCALQPDVRADKPSPDADAMAIKSVALSTNLVAGSALFMGEPTIATGDYTLTLTNGISGRGYTIDCTGKEGGLRFTADAEYTGLLRGKGHPRVWIDGCTLLFNGTWEGADSAQTSDYIHLASGGRFVIGPKAVLNQQLADRINARVFFADGGGTNEVVEIDPAFQADTSGFPDVDNWRAHGFSVLFMENVTLVTHRTASLPSIHKRAASGNHSHHGVIAFWKGTTNLWVVKTERQVFDGKLMWRHAGILRTETDLVQTGLFSEDAGCHFGSLGEDPMTLVKEGPANLEIMGTQAYSPGSLLEIREGRVGFHSDPADAGGVFRARFGAERHGPHLQVRIGPKGAARFAVPVKAGLASLASSGTVRVDSGRLDIVGDMTLDEQSVLEIAVTERKGYKIKAAEIRVGGTLTQAGALRITSVPGTGRYVLVSAGTLKGAFALELPEGRKGDYRNGVLTVSE